MNPKRIAFGILLATLMAGPACSQEQSATPATSSATQADQPAATAPRPMRIRIGGNVLQAQLVHVVQPEYPAGAKATGKVVLHAVIDYDGTVMKVEDVSGDPVLATAAMDAVKQWRYRPTLLNSQAVQVDTTVNVVFKLDKNGNLKPQPKTP